MSSLGQVVIIWLGTRIAFGILTYFAIVYGSQYTTHGLQRAWLLNGGVTHFSQFLIAWQQWDAGWYDRITLHGYDTQSVAFFPLYPLLIKALLTALSLLPISSQSSVSLSGILVSNLCALVAFAAIFLLASNESGTPRIAILTLLFLLSFPYAFFLTAPYTESTFLAAAAIALLCARRGRWLPAAIAAYLATLSRSTGIILLAPLAWEYARQHGWLALRAWTGSWWSRLERWRQVFAFAVLTLAAPLAVLTYMSYLQWRFHNPLAFVAALKSPEWGRQAMVPWQAIPLYIDRFMAQPHYGFWWSEMLLEGFLIAAFLGITAAAARTLPFSLTLYTVGLLLLVITAPTIRYDPLLSSGRYLLVSIPTFFALAHALDRHPAVGWSIIFAGTMLQAGFVTLWLTGAWVA